MNAQNSDMLCRNNDPFLLSRKADSTTEKQNLPSQTTAVDYMSLGKRVRLYRKRIALTQNQFASLMGMHPSTISHIERGGYRISLEAIVKAANILGCTVDELLCDSLDGARPIYESSLSSLSRQCSLKELRVLEDTLSAVLASMRGGPAWHYP